MFQRTALYSRPRHLLAISHTTSWQNTANSWT